MGRGNVARLLLFLHACGWWTSSAAGATPVANMTSANLMPPSDGQKGQSIYLREVDDKYVYVQRKITSVFYNIDVRIQFFSLGQEKLVVC